MNCAEVQTQLLEYLDKSLDMISTKHLELHLASCPPCRAEAETLADCIQNVAALPVVEVPIGFAQRVMAHVREIEARPSLWQRLLRLASPARLPMSATALLLVGVFAVLLYHKEQPLQPNDRAEKTLNTASSASLIDSKKQQEAAGESAANLTARNVERERVETKPAGATAKPPVEIARAKKTDVAPQPAVGSEVERRFQDGQEAPKRPPIPVQEVTTGRDGPRSSGEVFGIGGIPFPARQSVVPSTTTTAPDPFFSIHEPSVDVEFVVRRRTEHRRDLKETESVDAIRKQAESDTPSQAGVARRATPSPSSLNAAVIEIRWFSVSPEHFDQFKKELAAQASIETETVTGRRERESALRADRPLNVKVTILPSTDR
jgi:hypothetical protein